MPKSKVECVPKGNREQHNPTFNSAFHKPGVNEKSDNPQSFTQLANGQTLKISKRDAADKNDDAQEDPNELSAKGGNDIPNDRVKRHFSSLLKFRGAPIYSKTMSYQSEPEFRLSSENDAVLGLPSEGDGDYNPFLSKRFLGSTFKSLNTPQRFLLYPQKKNIQSLIKSRYYSPVYPKRFIGSVLKSKQFGRNLNSFRPEYGFLSATGVVDDPSYRDRSKKHLSSLRGYGYSYKMPSKRFLGSLLKSPNFEIGTGGGFKRYYDQAMMREREDPEYYDDNDKKVFPFPLVSSIEYVDNIGPTKRFSTSYEDDQYPDDDYFSVNPPQDTDKRHISSLIKNRHGSIRKRQILKSDEMKDGAASNITDPQPPLNDKPIEKRHISSLMDADKRSFSSLLKASKDEIDKRHISSLIKNRYSSAGKRHFSSLLDNTIPTNKRFSDLDYWNQLNDVDKRHLSSLIQNLEDKRHLASLLQNAYGTIEKKHLSSLLDTDNMDKRHLSSLLDTDNMDKRHLSSLLDTGNMDKRHLSSLLDTDNMDKRHLSSLLDTDNMDKRHLSSLLDTDNMDKRHLSSLLDTDNMDKRHLSSLLDTDNMNKRHLSSLLDSDINKRHISSLFDSNNMNKRHFSSLLDSNVMDKRHLSSLLDANNIDKRHFASLLDSDNMDKRHFSSLLDSDSFDKRHFSSLLDSGTDKRHLSSLLDSGSNLDKRHLSSLLDSNNVNKRYLASVIDSNNVDKRHFSSLLDSDNNKKRHFSSLLDSDVMNLENLGSSKRSLPSLLQNVNTNAELDSVRAVLPNKYKNPADISFNLAKDEMYPVADKRFFRTLFREEGGIDKRSLQLADDLELDKLLLDEQKRHLSSLREGKRADEDTTTEEKRHISSLRDGKRAEHDSTSEEKRHLASLREEKRSGEAKNDAKGEEKQHISSLRDGKRASNSNYEKGQLSSSGDGKKPEIDLKEEKRHLSSLRDNKRSSDDEKTEDKRHLASLRGDKRADNDATQEEKRHISSLRDDKRSYTEDINDYKRNIASLTRNRNRSFGKRHFSSLLDNDGNRKRFFPLIYQKMGEISPNNYDEVINFNPQIDEIPLNGNKRHLASLIDGKRVDNNLFSTDEFENVQKRHLSSLRDGKRFYYDTLDENPVMNNFETADKRHLSSLLDSDRYNYDRRSALDFDKRHLSSLRNDKRVFYFPYNQEKMDLTSLEEEKRDGSATLDDDQINMMGENKRHLSSLREGKRHLSSLREGKRQPYNDEDMYTLPNADEHNEKDFNEEDLLAIKRHLASLRHQKRHLEMTEENPKRSFSSVLKSKTYLPVSHSRKKRYIGALIKNRNLPFRSAWGIHRFSRGFWGGFPKKSYGSFAPDQTTSLPFQGYPQYSSIPVVPLMLTPEDQRQQSQSTNDLSLDDSLNEGDEMAPQQGLTLDRGTHRRNSRLRGEDSNDFWVTDDEGFFQPGKKRFLGSLARRMWFPRPYRSFVEFTPSSGMGLSYDSSTMGNLSGISESPF